MTHLKSRSHITRLKEFCGGEKLKEGKKILKECLFLWREYPIEEASWIQVKQFSHPRKLKAYLDEDNPEEERV